MKKYLKDTWVNYIIALTFSFMLFIVEPINLYSSNLNDFWFDLNILLNPSIIMFVFSFLVIVIISNIIYFISKKIYKYVNVTLFICFLCTYIQGNFLAGSLPVLSGEVIDWSKYVVENIVSFVLWLVVIIATIIICKKIKIDNYIKYSGYVTLAILAMISVSFVSVFLTTDVLKYKDKDFIATATYDNLDKYSENNNLIILLIDAADSRYFAKAIDNNPEFKDTLKDFTYYPDTMSVHPFTQESIPVILSGEVYENQGDKIEFVTKAMKKSKMIKTLYDSNYEVNIYDSDILFNDTDALKVANIVNEKKNGIALNKKSFIKQEIKYLLFRYLPFYLKQFSKIETMNFNDTKIKIKEIDNYSEDNFYFVDYINSHMIKKDYKNNFKFIHLIGAHVPFTFKKDLSRIENGSYEDVIEGSLNIVNIYLNKLKESGVYDNSSIIVMADHGYSPSEDGLGHLEGRQNPIMYIKGKDENHERMLISDKAISFTDLQDVYGDLINNKKSNELFLNINNNRIRRYILYEYENPNHMVEYETKGKAWETEKMYKTGKEFNLN